MGKFALVLGRVVVFLVCTTVLVAATPLHLHTSPLAKIFLAIGAVIAALVLLDG